MSQSRIHRLLKIIGLLQAGKGWNVDGLAQECSVSRRTLFRDLDLLRQAGVPLRFDAEQQRYRIPGVFYLAPTNFTPEEALAMLLLCHDLGNGNGLPFLSAARSAAIKLESALPGRLRESLQEVTGAVEIHPPPRNPLQGQQSVYDQLLASVAARRAVRITYQSLTEWQSIQTRLHPYRLLFSRRSWYVIGRSSLHRATRTFNLARITAVTLLDDTYAVPRGFSISRYLRNAWHIIPERGRDRQVRIRFQKMVAQNVAEVLWHKTQQVAFNDDGTMDFSATVSGLNEISWWILGYGDQAQVLEPPELRRLVADRAAKTAKQYESRGERGEG